MSGLLIKNLYKIIDINLLVSYSLHMIKEFAMTHTSETITQNDNIAAMVELMKAKLQTMQNSANNNAILPAKTVAREAAKDSFCIRSFMAEAI